MEEKLTFEELLELDGFICFSGICGTHVQNELPSDLPRGRVKIGKTVRDLIQDVFPKDLILRPLFFGHHEFFIFFHHPGRGHVPMASHDAFQDRSFFLIIPDKIPGTLRVPRIIRSHKGIAVQKGVEFSFISFCPHQILFRHIAERTCVGKPVHRFRGTSFQDLLMEVPGIKLKSPLVPYICLLFSAQGTPLRPLSRSGRSR